MTSTDVIVGSDLRLVCSKDELVQRLSVVARGVSTRSAVQILSGILLRAEASELQLAATDMELSLRASLHAEVEGEGAVVVPGRLLVDISRALPAEEVRLTHNVEANRLRIECGNAQFELHTYAAEDFPRLPDVADAALHAVEKDALLQTISRVGRAASRDESRPVLTGILVRFEGSKLVMVATDSYRLSVKETALSEQLPELEAIIPARALTELARVAAGGERVELGMQENQVLFAVDGVTLTTRRIDGQFPNYKQLIPEQFEHNVTLPRDEVLDVVKRTSLMAQRNSPLRLRFAEGELTVSAQTADVGESRESLPVPFSGEAMEIGFNAEFLRDGLESVESEDVTLKLISPLRPAVLEGSEGDFSYLIMPIRLAG
jgi:DNA polymerase-3 subunit beta